MIIIKQNFTIIKLFILLVTGAIAVTAGTSRIKNDVVADDGRVASKTAATAAKETTITKLVELDAFIFEENTSNDEDAIVVSDGSDGNSRINAIDRQLVAPELYYPTPPPFRTPVAPPMNLPPIAPSSPTSVNPPLASPPPPPPSSSPPPPAPTASSSSSSSSSKSSTSKSNKSSSSSSSSSKGSKKSSSSKGSKKSSKKSKSSSKKKSSSSKGRGSNNKKSSSNKSWKSSSSSSSSYLRHYTIEAEEADPIF